MKLLGMLLIFLSSTAIGFYKAETYKERDREFGELISLVYFIKHEISAYLTPQYMIYEKYKGESLEKNGFLPRLREYSAQGIEFPLMRALNDCNTLKINEETRSTLNDFSQTLGTLGIDDECEQCNKTIRSLEEQYQKRKEETSGKTRLCKSVGGMIGMGIVLLLW